MRLVTAVGALLLGGCTAAPARITDGPVPLARGSADDFAAVVPPSSSAGYCEVRRTDSEGPGDRVITLVRDEPTRQRISVIVDADGLPLRYMDVRGDLSTSADSRADRTTIGLYVTEGYAVAGNRPAGKELEVLEIPLAEAVASENLGNPGEVLEHVLSRCGGAI